MRSTREMATYEDYANNGSLLYGDMGTALLIMRLEPNSARRTVSGRDRLLRSAVGAAAAPGFRSLT